jgi:hypothetical protein
VDSVSEWKVGSGSGSALKWKFEFASKWKDGSLRGSFLGHCKVQSGRIRISLKLKGRIGSGSTSDWKVGYGSGSSSKWKAWSARWCGSAT